MTTRAIIFSGSELRQALLALTAVSALFLGACTQVDMPSQIRPDRVQLQTQNYSERFTTADVGAAELDAIAADYGRYGSGEAEIIIAYDPLSRKNTAMKASDELHRISEELSKRNVHNLKSSILAVENSGDQSEMIIGYKSITALPPDDCQLMPGYETSQAEADFDYKMGCSTETMISRQVAHPEDLGGRAPEASGGDGRRGGAVVEPYRAGTPNSALSGESASGG